MRRLPPLLALILVLPVVVVTAETPDVPNTHTSALEIEPGTHEGSLALDDRADWYKISPSPVKALRIELTTPTSVPIALRVLDANGVTIVGATGPNAQPVWSSTVYIGVERASVDTTYNLTVSLLTRPDFAITGMRIVAPPITPAAPDATHPLSRAVEVDISNDGPFTAIVNLAVTWSTSTDAGLLKERFFGTKFRAVTVGPESTVTASVLLEPNGTGAIGDFTATATISHNTDKNAANNQDSENGSFGLGGFGGVQL